MTPDEAIEKARWYEREDIATTLREEANVLAAECERLRELVEEAEAEVERRGDRVTTLRQMVSEREDELTRMQAELAALKGTK